MSINQMTIDEIKKLRVSEKVLIVEDIWDSIAKANEYPELTEAQHKELSRRSDSYHAGSFRGRAWEEIKNDYWKSEQT
jgi:putative addiction module component (TIGR02574 family)